MPLAGFQGQGNPHDLAAGPNGSAGQPLGLRRHQGRWLRRMAKTDGCGGWLRPGTLA